MARPKQFDRDEALLTAINLFAHQGYGGTSTDELRASMGIGRQSFYDTFVSKYDLYLEALQRYNREQAMQIGVDLCGGASPIEGLTRVLLSFVNRCEENVEPACLGTSAICEFGQRDPMINEAIAAIGNFVLEPLVQKLKRAQEANEIRTDIDADLAAHFLLATLGGLKISARAGMPTVQLRQIALLALQALK